MAAPKTDKACRAYYIAGDDDFRKQRELDALLAELVAPDFADFDLEQIDGDAATADRVMAGLGIPPFYSPRRVVLVKYANKMDEDEQKKLAGIIDRAPASGCLVMMSPAPEKVDGKVRKGSEIIGDLSKAVRKVGKVIRVGGETTKEKSGMAREFAQRLFSEAGKKIQPAVLNAFIQRVGSDYLILSSEVRKLIDYAGESAVITQDDVAAVTSETAEEKIFKMLDSISAKRPADAMKHLDELFETGDRPESDAPKVLSNMARQYRLIWQAKLLQAARVKAMRKDAVPEKVRALLPSSPNILEVAARQSWQADRFSAAAKRWCREDLVRCFTAIARTDAMLKGIEGDVDDPRMAMELLVLELAG